MGDRLFVYLDPEGRSLVWLFRSQGRIICLSILACLDPKGGSFAWVLCLDSKRELFAWVFWRVQIPREDRLLGSFDVFRF